LILNVFGFIVSAIWLLVIGQWTSVLAGLAISFIAPTLLGIALLPGMAIAAPGVYFANRSVTIGVYFFGFLSSAFIYVLITAWCGGVTFYFLRDAPANAFWPLLIWSYGVATSPWTYLAQQDQGPTSFIAAFFAQVAFIVTMLCAALGMDIADAFQIFALVMMVGVFVHMRLLAEMQRMGAV